MVLLKRISLIIVFVFCANKLFAQNNETVVLDTVFVYSENSSKNYKNYGKRLNKTATVFSEDKMKTTNVDSFMFVTLIPNLNKNGIEIKKITLPINKFDTSQIEIQFLIFNDNDFKKAIFKERINPSKIINKEYNIIFNNYPLVFKNKFYIGYRCLYKGERRYKYVFFNNGLTYASTLAFYKGKTFLQKNNFVKDYPINIHYVPL